MSGAYDLRFAWQPPLLRATVAGDDSSPQTTLEYWRQIAGEVRGRGAELLLFLDRITGPVMTEPQLSSFFAHIAGEGLEEIRIGYVEHSLEQMQNIELAELMARERGYRVRMFAHEARRWIGCGTASSAIDLRRPADCPRVCPVANMIAGVVTSRYRRRWPQ